MPSFSHLHSHTQFSLLMVQPDFELYKKAVKDEMRAIAITDHGNMFGVLSSWPKPASTKMKTAH
jgi:DNA polymerase-3 subunit alpha